MTQFLYGMWCMWLIMCVIARDNMSLMVFVVTAIIIPGLLVMVGRGVALLVKWCAFKWERRV